MQISIFAIVVFVVTSFVIGASIGSIMGSPSVSTAIGNCGVQ